MRYTSNKGINALSRKLLKQEWTFQRRTKHAQLTSPEKASICVAISRAVHTD